MSFDVEKILWPMIGTTILIILAGAGIIWARSIRTWSSRAGSNEPFTLQDLREMLKRGEITQSEFETMKAALIGSVRTPQTPRTGRTDGPAPHPRMDE